jgi:hypothetical protein
MVRAVGENTFQPKIGFKTRYGIVANPFAEGAARPQALVVSDQATVLTTYYQKS